MAYNFIIVDICFEESLLPYIMMKLTHKKIENIDTHPNI
jgi:hypothetical protein